MIQGLTMGFSSVYVWVRQLGAWKLHPYNFIALIHVSFKIIQILPKLAHVLETNS